MKNNAPVEFLTKRILHIDPNERYKRQPSDLDVRARQATSDVFFEDEPTTTAVGSLLVGSVVTSVQERQPGVYANEDIAKALSVIVGAILLFIGLFRLGWLIEFIPYVPISAFVTAASITIMSTQLPVALGISGVNTREAPYKVILNTLEGLPRTQLDAAIGLTSIALLFFIRDVCARMEIRQPTKKRMWGMISSLRLTFTILLYTFISYLVHRKSPEGESKFHIVGHIQSGFKHAGVPVLDSKLVGLILPELPAIAIILIIEHIAIAKSFGRIFNYTINPSQEVLAQGMANLFGPFVGGYVCTGSFGASAVLSKAGVRTPLAGLVSAMVLVLALYALTAVFYYIPRAALAGLIIHATSNLMTPPKNLYRYWQLSPFELIIWIVGVVLALFLSLETSIYVTIGLSFALLLLRNARSKGRFLGRLRVHRLAPGTTDKMVEDSRSSGPKEVDMARDVFLPLDRKDCSNPNVGVESPYPGVFIYRFSEGFNYVNQAHHIDQILSFILENTRPTRADDGLKAKDRLWNDPGPAFKPVSKLESSKQRPLLHAVVLDCSSVNNMDITSVQGLIDLRNTLDRYAAPSTAEWHFAGVLNRWTRRALAVAGFGFPAADNPDAIGNWSPAYTVASSLAGATEDDARRAAAFEALLRASDEERSTSKAQVHVEDVDTDDSNSAGGETKKNGGGRANVGVVAPGHRFTPVHGVDRPFFHIDLVEAVDAAIRDAMKKNARAADEPTHR
ncbi:putative sulfate permease protein [Phaeoacremonium minimum UCRPA7]|uniref:Putative sulfate permease protein n=1 Tax=Phaeoacremonium minimum (strain UCR-PA7) TaxID=1286976 RepID=R8B8K3_PHAM7|nr:putative sulfate permease protein [Phaeoacremonium minimum UCRPA7]EON95628.1 putative sulfate permease protein [Phaeoacremonium minimum UCRPA7]